MNTHAMRTSLGLVVSLGLFGCSMAMQRHPERGAPVRLTMVADSALKFTGELLAVSNDSLWLRDTHATVRVWPLASISSVRVSRQTQVFARTVLRGVAFGAVSGAALAGACSTISDGCEAVMGIWTGVFTGVSLLAGGLSHAQVEYLRVHPPTRPALAPWARYPQGLPPAVGRGEASAPPARDGPPAGKR
ncbi:MAG: hypothetical protein K2R93_07595 [Gemmatimonadaceae bacterium]|nr:hypothetical protein [Gemmatimonadaceae bacterium]